MARLIAGIQPVREAIRAHGARIERVLVQSGQAPQLAALARFAKDQGIEVSEVDRGELDRTAQGAHHQGVLAFVPPLALVSLEELPLPSDALFIALDGIQDPQNFGAAVRSAVALGSGTVLFPEHASAPLSLATFRASAGAVEHATLCRVPSLVTAIGWLLERGLSVVALDAGAGTELSQVDLTGPVVLVLGSEGKGLGRAVRRACPVVAELPMPGPIGSLNASVATAVALYEALRQRRQPPAPPRAG